MHKKPEVALFSMSQAKLVTTTTDAIRFLRRDLAALTQRGMSDTRINSLEGLLLAFVALPTEVEGVQLAAAATQEKEDKRVLVLGLMQDIMGKVRLKHGNSTAGYKAFGTAGLNSAGDSDLYVGLVRVVRVGRATLDTYKDQGLTTDDLALLAVENEKFLTAIGHAHDLESAAESATQTRLAAANVLYQTLMADCEVGKETFVQTDVTKHDDYVVYDTPDDGDAPATQQPG